MASPLQSTPPLPTRAFQWDLARQVERLDWLLAQLPRYADWGYQELYLHLEDAVEFPNLPGVARADAYTHRQQPRFAGYTKRKRQDFLEKYRNFISNLWFLGIWLKC